MNILGREITIGTNGNDRLDQLESRIIQLQQTNDRLKARNRALTSAPGGTGTPIYGGYLDEEWNALLKGGKWYTVVDKMVRSDAQVRASEYAATLPIRSATWTIEAASDDNIDQQIAETLRNNLFGGMVQSFDDFIRQALLCLRYGSMGFVPVYELKDGLFQWRKFASRKPSTFQKYDIDPDTEELRGVEQWTIKVDRTINETIPAERLMLFVCQMEGANYKGDSIFRPAWKHWRIKDMLYKTNAIAFERWAAGFLTINQTETGSFDEDKAVDIAENFRANEAAYLVLPYGYGKEITFPMGQVPDPSSMIQHHNRMISQSILAAFINLGQDKVGSYALSRDQKDLFFLAIQAFVKYIQGILNQQIREWVDFNYVVRDNYPTIAVENLQAKDHRTIAAALYQLSQAGHITPGPEIEDWVRNILGAPPVPDEQKEAKFEGRESIALQSSREPDYKPWRELRPEERYLDIQGITKKLNGEEQDFTKIAKGLRQQQIKIMLERGLKALMKKTDTEFYKAVDDIKVPYFTKMKTELAGVLKDIYQFGKQKVREEIAASRRLQLQGETFEPVEGDQASNRYLSKVAEQSSDKLNRDLLFALGTGLYALHRAGKQDLTNLRMQLESRSDRSIRDAAGYAVSSAFNLGRETEAQAQLKAGSIQEEAIYSAILDGNTCDQCSRADGATMDVGSARYYDLQPPLNSSEFGACDGAGRCRCIRIYQAREKAA